jgi:hypothetical protein
MRARLTLAFASMALAGCQPAGIDLEGRAVEPISAGTTVLVFASTSCPISNRYAPELARLHARFAPRGAAFFLVYADGEEPLALLRRHHAEHAYPFPALRDPARRLARASQATITPEAAVFTAGRLAYHGRIDDRFIDFGKERAAPTHHDLADAVEASLAGRPPPSATEPALGCTIP